LSRRDYYPFPSFGGELFSLSPFAFLREMTDWMDRSMAGTPSRAGKAEFRNGVLEVNVPIEEPKTNRRQIQIQATSSRGTASVGTASAGSGSVQR
jgi:hypothetical protein